MITKNQLKEAQSLCKAIAKYRATGICEMRCTAEATDGHHAFFGRRWRAYWELLVNENYYIGLCNHHHVIDAASPHKDDDRFWGLIKEERTREVERKRLCRIPPTRVALLLSQRARLHQQKFKPDRECDGKAELQRLRKEFERWKNIYEIDINTRQIPY